MIRFAASLLLTGALLFSGAGASEEGIVLNLHSQAVVSGTNYTLGEVASVMTGSNTRPELEKIPLGLSPRLGYSETVTRAQIVKFIESHYPELRGRIAWRGSRAVAVRGRGMRYDKQNLIAAAHDFLYAHLAPGFERLELTPVGKLDDLYYPAGALVVVQRVNAAGRLKRICVWLDASVDGAHYRTIPVWFGVRAYKTVWVAKTDLAARQRLTPQDVVAEQRDIAGIPGAILAGFEPVQSVWVKRPAMAGSVLLAENVEEIPPVRRAQAVRVKVISGKVELETRGVALQDGKIGQRVQIARQDNAETFFARVQGEGTVLIDGRTCDVCN